MSAKLSFPQTDSFDGDHLGSQHYISNILSLNTFILIQLILRPKNRQNKKTILI